MSTYDDASLVLIPSGYKNGIVFSQKPMDANGQLTFTRASSATRVQSDGLIEKVRTNLALYSEDATNAIYVKTNATVTANSIAAPDGTLTADTITATAASGLIQGVVTITSGLVYTMSVYLKRKTGTGVVQLRGVSNTSTTVTITNDWARYSVSLTAADVNGRYGVLLLTSGDEVYCWGFQLETSDIATDYIATTTATVSVGPVSGLPRLDYLNSTCPKLLLEPQRSNLVTFSENFDNAAWTKSGASVTANAVLGPDGYTSADKLVENTSNSEHIVTQSNLFTATGAFYTASIFVKAAERTYVAFSTRGAFTANSNTLIFNLTTGEWELDDSTQNFALNAEAFPNGWYRISLNTNTTSGAFDNFGVGTAIGSSSWLNAVYTGDGTSGIYIWGAQLEAGAYATSYIPTLSASVTRVADAASKTGISSLIGQTEGVIFADIDLTSRSSFSYFAIAPNLGSTSAYIGISITATVFGFEVVNSGVQFSYNFPSTATGRFKLALGYKANDFVAYVNGVQVSFDTSGTVPACSQLGVNNYSTLAALNYNQALLFKTRLDNATLQSLTTL
jgi:hypothetical protein